MSNHNEGKAGSHEFEMTLDDLIECSGIDGLNDAHQDSLRASGSQDYATGMSYQAVNVSQQGTITVRSQYVADPEHDA